MADFSIFTSPEILEMVVLFLGTKERREAVLVCRAFYEEICRVEQNKTLKVVAKMIIDESIFNSTMRSCRRFKEIKINTLREEWADRIAVIVGKFKKHLKILTVQCFPLSSKETYSRFMDAAVDVEELTLHWFEIKTDDTNDRTTLVLQKEFSRLKQLSVCGFHEINGILEKIQKDSLEGLTVKSHLLRQTLSEESLQTFLNQQTKLKRLDVRFSQNLNFDRLKLEDLSLFGRNDEDLTTLLKNQPTLRQLRCDSIGVVAFKELQKIENLEVLLADVTGEAAGNLRNLKKLGLYGNCAIMLHVGLPNLVKLTIGLVEFTLETSSVTSEHFLALSRSARNLQHIEIANTSMYFLYEIIEHFPALKTLLVDSSSGAYSRPVPLVNLSLEEIIIRPCHPLNRNASICDTINACPNLKRIQLYNVTVTIQQVLGLIQNHPHLTHFYLGVIKVGRNRGEVNSLDLRLVEIINIFKNSQEFVCLKLSIDGVQRPLIKTLFDVYADEIIVTEFQKPISKTCDLMLTKKMETRDPFAKFHEKQIAFLSET